MTAGFVRFLLPLFLGTLLTSCSYVVDKQPQQIAEGELTEAQISSLSYATLQQAVFVPKCTTCHGSLGGVNLETYENVLLNLSAVKRTALETKTMPKGGFLTQYEAALLRKWIDMGAPLEVGSNPVPTPEPIPEVPDSPTGEVSYQKVNARVFAVSCVRCHNAQISSGSVRLDTYSSVRKNLAAIRRTVFVTKTMPKGESLSQAQSDLLREWISQGAPGGGGSNGPAPVPTVDPQPSPTPTVEPLEATFESIQKNVLMVRCTMCHGSGGSAQHIPLLTREDLLNSPREIVIPGNADESGLVLALEREDEKRMPPQSAGQPLSEQEIKIIREWITNGAN